MLWCDVLYVVTSAHRLLMTVAETAQVSSWWKWKEECLSGKYPFLRRPVQQRQKNEKLPNETNVL